MSISPQTVYKNLKLLEQGDASSSAFYRQLAQETLADREISLKWRQAIADRLNQANHLLGVVTADNNDSY
jgi:hypothetical protein